MTPNMSVSIVEKSLNDVLAQPRQNNKPVECRLKLTYQKLAATEAKIYMFSTLKSMNLSTNDYFGDFMLFIKEHVFLSSFCQNCGLMRSITK